MSCKTCFGAICGPSNLREFVNSRHPSPRRVWKVGSVARWLPPLPVDPARRFCVPNDGFVYAKRYFSLPEGTQISPWPRPGPRQPNGRQRDPKGHPKGAQGHPRGAKEAESRPKGTPKDGQREPKVTPGEQKGPQSRPKGSQGSPKSPQRKPQARQRHPWEARGTRYTFKTPDQPHSGRYVIDSVFVNSCWT